MAGAEKRFVFEPICVAAALPNTLFVDPKAGGFIELPKVFVGFGLPNTGVELFGLDIPNAFSTLGCVDDVLLDPNIGVF